MIRLGVRSLVLEQAEGIRTGGTSLTLFKNGWGVLDAIGVGNELRSQFIEIEGYVFYAKCLLCYSKCKGVYASELFIFTIRH